MSDVSITPSSPTSRAVGPLLEIDHLCASVEGKPVLKGLSLKIYPGEVHAIMGRNGAGKTTLSGAIMGHPKVQITAGRILFQGEDLAELSTFERARKRLFLAFQYPVAVPGVTVAQVLRAAIQAVRGDEVPSREVRARIRKELQALEIPETFMTRSLNDGFSGGEKKRLETLQMRLLEPKMAILDETDSGLDIDAMRTIARKVEEMRTPERSFLVITHYQRLLEALQPDVIHVMLDGRIVETGGKDLALQLEAEGYERFETASRLAASSPLSRMGAL